MGNSKTYLKWLNHQDLLSFRLCTWVVLGCFIAFLAIGASMLFYTSPTVYKCGLVAESFLALSSMAYAITISSYLYTRRRYSGLSTSQKYKRSLGYTVISSILAMNACLLLYPLRWHDGLTTNTLDLQSVTQNMIPLPAIAVISIPNRRDFANITTDKPPKCFISDWAGGFNDVESMCSTIPTDQALRHHNCSCADMWSPQQHGLADDYYEDIPYQILQPGPNLVVNSTLATFVLQLYSNFNSSRTPAGYPIPGPALTILLYDRNISITDAFKHEYGTRTTIDAHGTTVLSITPEYRIGFNRNPYYMYTTDSTGNESDLNMACDIAKPDEYTGPCFFTLDIRLTSLNRLEVINRKKMSPLDVCVEFGAYYAFFQFVAWLCAGMATSAT